MSTATKVARSRRSGSALPRYLLRRLGTSIVLLFGVTLVTFVLTALVPGDPIAAALGEGAIQNEATVEAYRERYGMDRSLPERYLLYLLALVQGDLGTSIRTSRPVSEELAVALPATIEVAFAAIVFPSPLLLSWEPSPHAVAEGLRPGRPCDLPGWPECADFLVSDHGLPPVLHAAGMGSRVGRLSPALNPPPRITGLYLVDFALDGDPVGFFDAAAHLALPVLVLSMFTIGLLTRFIRSSVLEVLSTDYVRAARAKGLSTQRVIVGYLLRGASLPILTMVGVAFGALLSGTVLVEAVFAWPGLGTYAYYAAINLDLPAVMGVGLVVGVIYVVINLVVDLLYGVLDPRVRLG